MFCIKQEPIGLIEGLLVLPGRLVDRLSAIEDALVGGGMCKTGWPFLELVIRKLRRRQEGCHFLSAIDIPSRLRLASTDQPLGAIGAALVLDEYYRYAYARKPAWQHI